MPQYNYSSAVEEIKSRCSVVDVVGSVVQLKRAGRNYKGLCPFHKEKTPSFIVSEDKGTYHCFGCGEHGDSIGFVMKYYNLSFTEAVEKLCAQYGIALEISSDGGGKSLEPLYEINKQAARFYFEAIKRPGNPAFKYITGRGLEPSTLQKFGIGYADDEWTSLTDYMIRNGVSKADLLELGLCSEKNGRLYDKMRGRVIFPIINTRGKVIGFGGRIMGPGEPKYLNSSESSVYQKKLNLFGLNITRQEIQKEGQAILVEGYMDMVSLWQGGVKNVAASLGTALMPQQAKLLKRYANKVVLCYDSDAAGVKAALRGIDVLREAGLSVRVLQVDDGKDPDEYIKAHGRDAFMNLLRNRSVTDIDYKIALINRKYDRRDTEQNIRFLKAVAGVLKTLSPVEADVYIKKVSENFSVSEQALRSEIGSAALPDSKASEMPKSKRELPAYFKEADLKLEETVLRLCILKYDYFTKFQDYGDAFVSPEGKQIAKAIEDSQGRSEEGEEYFKDALYEDSYAYFHRIMAEVILGEKDEDIYEDCLEKLKRRRKERRINEILEALDMIDSLEGDEQKTESERLLRELTELRKEEK